MKIARYVWILVVLGVIAAIAVPAIIFWPRTAQSAEDPWAFVPVHAVHTDHSGIITGPLETPQDVTKNCLECHPDAATEVMVTSHWTWESEPFDLPWRDEPVTVGKINQINNFCIGSQGNEIRCMTCHVGYAWEQGKESVLSQVENVDCLACHADTTAYAKGEYGNPMEGIDLLESARSVRAPTRDNCGKCHFDGGGGNGVKHGDLDESLYFPSDNLDIHMGRHDMLCTDCHQAEAHAIKGRIAADNPIVDPTEQVACTDCHGANLHSDERINAHLETVACQTCHIPSMALKDPTKMTWDWSTAGQDIGDDHYTYLKIKGSFVYESDVTPTYTWWNGNQAYRYILGDKIDPTQPTYINLPAGDINDPQAKIFPFKLHIAKQPYDAGNNYLLSPITAGEGGYWIDFDWDQAFDLAEEITGLDYSGEYGFAETWMYWPTTHMVQPKENALQCTACHGSEGRLDWQALGYSGDPMDWGGRFSNK